MTYWYEFSSVVFYRAFHLSIFHSYGDVTIAGEGLQIWPILGTSWRLSSDCSLACHTYCETGHPHPEDPWYTYSRAFCSGAVTTSTYDLGLSWLRFEHSTFRLQGNALTHCTTAAVHRKGKETVNCTFKKSMQGECMQVFQKFGRHRAIPILTICLYYTGTPHLNLRTFFYPIWNSI